jgi:prepilin-type N-terminal cleavage/methylation domain-containing protein
MRRAFTLIELLIVVAIIAILAAIAVPNFLEAQVRAKVSRAKADIRSVATAFESYAVDNNYYPPDITDTTGIRFGPGIGGYYWYISNAVTTPVSYLTSNNFKDPFRDKGDPTSPALGPEYLRFRYVNYGLAGLYNTWGGVPGSVSTVQAYERGGSVYGKWRLSSSGPDRAAGARIGGSSFFPTSDSFVGPNIPYDPTNGTISPGDIMRSQKDPEPKVLNY